MNEMPQNTPVDEQENVLKEEIISNASIAEESSAAQVQEAPTPANPALSGGEDGKPFVIDAAQFKKMSPDQIFQMAGEIVGKNHERMNEEKIAADTREQEDFILENQEDIETIKSEIAAEHRALEEKYGPEENWPAEAKNAVNTHRIGWGMVGVAGLGAFAGMTASADAQADLGSILGNRTSQGIQIEASARNQREQMELNFQNQRKNLEMRIKQERDRMEQRFKMQEQQKNLQYKQELNRLEMERSAVEKRWEITPNHTEQQKEEIKMRYDLKEQETRLRQDNDWSNFVLQIQSQREQYELNATNQLQQLETNYQYQREQSQLSREAQHRQANTSAEQQVIREGIGGILNQGRGLFGR